MAQDGFKHISVTAADEEDFVIHAGSGSAPAPQPQPQPQAEARQETASDLASKQNPPASGVSAPTRQKADKSPRNDYQPTTLDDLKGKPMPAMQKIIIIAAVLCIIGAIVYCVAFMG